MAQKNIVGMLEMTQGQIISIAEAFDESELNWRPAEGYGLPEKQ